MSFHSVIVSIEKAKYLLVCCLVFLFSFSLQAQDKAPKNWNIQGYVKSLQGLFIVDAPGLPSQSVTDNFLHYRLNLNWYPSDKWTFKMGLRTRYFFGEFSRITPNYGKLLDESGNDVLPLTLINAGKKTIFHSIIDRAYWQYNKDKLEVRLGRQRINWGINTVWNPNDIFNAYSFTDFDYEERPGSDALRLQYYIGFSGSLEFAVKAFDNSDEVVAGALYRFNKKNYDFQILAGWSHQDLVLGGGWEGQIKNAGFKGEFSWFKSTQDSIANSFAAALSLDYSFSNNLIFAGGMLYNYAASKSDQSDIFSFELSARNLYPFEWSVFTSGTYPVTPLFTTSLALIYSPVAGHPLFVNPTLTYSLGQDLDVDLVGQIAFQGTEQGYQNNTQVYYIRVKWSY